MIGAELKGITAPGDKYILFVTDGEPDYCGDGNVLCPPDAVVAELQALKANNITTIVFGLQSAERGHPAHDLAGVRQRRRRRADEVVPLRPGTTDINVLFDQCFPGGDSASAGWKADFLAKYPECATELQHLPRAHASAPTRRRPARPSRTSPPRPTRRSWSSSCERRCRTPRAASSI